MRKGLDAIINMRKIALFMMVSLDGYFEGLNHDLSWHNVDMEFNDFAVKQLKKSDTILFGRRTYQLMESYWPSTQGLKDDPEVANLMNNTAKIVFSKSLKEVSETKYWKNVRLIKDNLAQEINSLKKNPGKDIIVLGSSKLCVTLLKEKLLDEVRIMLNPVAIGSGTPLFQGIKSKQKFNLESTRKFKNGNILLTYETVK